MSESKPARGAAAIAIMITATLAPYFISHIKAGSWRLLGSDYEQLHRRRIDYVRENFQARGEIPGWYSRELGGSPFWSNVQNFPLIPTRFAVLLFDGEFGLTIGSELAASLAALFTYLYARRIGLGYTASATAGWTFASAGYFAARIRAGHLPLLEAYPALPLLLWLTERALVWRPDERAGWRARLIVLALACWCVALAGHPQLPFYAIACAGCYALYRMRGRRTISVIGAMVCGVALAGFSIWPMTRLILRSTRILNLDRAANDIALPYARIGAFLFPWKDGWPNGQGAHAFTAYQTPAYFWDTVSYIGWLPLIAAVALLLRAVAQRKWPAAPWPFFVVMSLAGLLLALPASRAVMEALPGTFLRSPARLLYLTTFGLALGLGAAVHNVLAAGASRKLVTGIGVVLVLGGHFWDLSWHNHHFYEPSPPLIVVEPGVRDAIRSRIGDGRIGMDISAQVDLNRRIDDTGFFDSIILATTYRGLLDLNGQPPRLNIQNANAAEFSPRALAAFGTKMVATFPPDAAVPGTIVFYELPQSSPRAEFFADANIEYLPEHQLHQRLRDPAADLSATLLLPGDAKPATREAAAPGAVTYARPSPDVIEVSCRASGSGYVRVIEAFDVGWRATVDGIAKPIARGNDMFLAVALPAGEHRVRFEFHTLGLKAGIVISIVALAGIMVLAYTSRP